MPCFGWMSLRREALGPSAPSRARRGWASGPCTPLGSSRACGTRTRFQSWGAAFILFTSSTYIAAHLAGILTATCIQGQQNRLAGEGTTGTPPRDGFPQSGGGAPCLQSLRKGGLRGGEKRHSASLSLANSFRPLKILRIGPTGGLGAD